MEFAPAPGLCGLPARVLLGWMGREQAASFLMDDCLFSQPLTLAHAEEIWQSFRANADELPDADPSPPQKLTLSAADLKAVRKFRNGHPEADLIVDFARFDPLELSVYQLWISTAIAERHRVSPDNWIDMALLNPPSSSRFNWSREGTTVTYDLPHAEFFLVGPLQPYGQLQLAQAKSFVTVFRDGNRVLLTSGYHRTFACARIASETPGAPRGALRAVTSQLAAIGVSVEDILRMLRGRRPPRMADFFDDRLFLPVTLRRKRYQARISFELLRLDADEAEQVGKASGSG